MFEGVLTSIVPDSEWTHEWASAMLFEAIMEENSEIIIKKGSSEAKFIQALIEGNPNDAPNEKRCLFEIISNSRNSIDVDKIDYILRDCRCMNLPYISFNPKLVL